MDDSIAKQIRLTYNAVDYKALLKKMLMLSNYMNWEGFHKKFTEEEWKALKELSND